MRLFGVKMELYWSCHFPSYAAVWPAIALFRITKSFPYINKKFPLRLLFSGHYNFLKLDFLFRCCSVSLVLTLFFTEMKRWPRFTAYFTYFDRNF